MRHTGYMDERASSHTHRRLVSFVGGPLLLLTLVAGVLAVSPHSASAAEVTHPTLAPEAPRRDIPIVLDGTVYSTVQFNDRVVVAGKFTQVESARGGPVVSRSNIFAYNINSGALINDFTPVVNGTIEEMVVSEDGHSLFIGGGFTKIDDEWNVRVAKLDYYGSVDDVFTASADAKVLALDTKDGVLFLGGSFDNVNGVSHDRIAAVDTVTGANIAAFDLSVQGNEGKAATRSVKALDIHPTQDLLLVAFNGRQLVDGNTPGADHYGVAFVNLNDFTVTNWKTDWFRLAHPRCSENALQLRDGEFSPDGSMFVLVEKGNWRCDKAVAFNTADNGTNDPKWVTAMHDSTFSVAITNNAVYVGGHFCYISAHGPIDADAAPTYPWVNKPVTCLSGGANVDIGDFSARYQLAALNPATGEPLDWEPVSNAQVAVHHIEAIDRGLLIGQDRDRVNFVRTGHHAFLDFGGATPSYIPPVAQTLDCTASVDNNGNVSLSWNALDGVSNWVVRRNEKWLSTQTSTTYADAPGTGTHEYVIRYKVGGTRRDGVCAPAITIANPEPPDGDCTATVNGTSVILEWADAANVNSWQVRRDGKWKTTTNALTYTDVNLANGEYSYTIRSRRNGSIVDTPCTPRPVTIGAAGGTPLSCSAATAGGDVTISWNTVAGVSDYQVRRDGKWLATSNAASYVDENAPGGAAYAVRYRIAGDRVTVDCN